MTGLNPATAPAEIAGVALEPRSRGRRPLENPETLPGAVPAPYLVGCRTWSKGRAVAIIGIVGPRQTRGGGDMEFTSEQMEAITSALDDLWSEESSGCWVCGENDWTIPPFLMELREFHGGPVVVGRSRYVPLLVVTCKNCGNTVTFNAFVLGILDPAEGIPEEPEAAAGSEVAEEGPS